MVTKQTQLADWWFAWFVCPIVCRASTLPLVQSYIFPKHNSGVVCGTLAISKSQQTNTVANYSLIFGSANCRMPNHKISDRTKCTINSKGVILFIWHTSRCFLCAILISLPCLLTWYTFNKHWGTECTKDWTLRREYRITWLTHA